MSGFHHGRGGITVPRSDTERSLSFVIAQSTSPCDLSMTATTQSPAHITFLRHCAWFCGLTPTLAKLVERTAIQRDVAAGAPVYQTGDPPKHWFGVMEGLLALAATSPKGKMTAVAAFFQGGWVGEASLLDGKRRRFDLLALRAASVACVPRATFLALYESSMSFNHFLVDKLARGMGQMQLSVATDRLLNHEKRLAMWLSRLVAGDTSSGVASLNMSQEEIGYLAGLSRQQTNVALKDLEARGLVAVHHGGICVLNLEGLAGLGRSA
jgi:CRP/FNR family transcriptional regulator, cyclic AMP receptor protein